ncbi:MAG: Crp/Fnr family transcriptional regulator [Gammaproteobacteria bacterium]|nr:MAG: Crp/Fnr family transcriptional regulator [Gammaproteobacteria bacterium]
MLEKISLKEAWTGLADCGQCAIRKSVLFAGLEVQDFGKIHDPIVQIELAPGDTLYRAGERSPRLFTLRKGLIKLVRYLPDGTQRIVRLIRSTDVTGLEALLDKPYEHHAIAMQDSELCVLPAAIVNQLSRENPALHRELLNRWQRALAEADQWLTDLSTGSARQRVARLILHLTHDDGDGPRCTLFSREEIGAMLGITTETASRIVADFRRRGILRTIESKRYEVDTEALAGLADGG